MRRLAAAAAAALLPITMAVAVSAPARAASGIRWTPCHGRFLCAQVHVPLDYDDPHGAQISIALAKEPATDPAHRIGSLFVNPGGPGGSGVDFLFGAVPKLFTPAVRARFDLIGFDPRGIGRSTQLQCYNTQGGADHARPDFAYPDSQERRTAWIASDRAIDAACAQRGGAILDHMSTANVARDLDRLRAAVGDRRLTYVGYSYGSFLGNVYANLFPDRVRSVVLDGVVNPIEWTTGTPNTAALPFSTRLRNARASLATLHEFFRLCDENPDNCALAPHSQAKYQQLYVRLRSHPVHYGGRLYDQTDLVEDTLGGMYASDVWSLFADFFVALRHRAWPTAEAGARTAMPRPPARYVDSLEGFSGVGCLDSVNPHSSAAWTAAANQSLRHDGLFGPLWTWLSSLCAHWPGHDDDRYLGPFDSYTTNPVLVVGNLVDPATPYTNAETVARMLPHSRLLTVDGWGHTSLYLSSCADANIARYLLTSQVPPPGTVCKQDVAPFQFE